MCDFETEILQSSYSCKTGLAGFDLQSAHAALSEHVLMCRGEDEAVSGNTYTDCC